jgi:hypothetical protein
MEKLTILVKELHLTSLREKYMSDPDIIPPSGTTKQEYVDQMVSQLERQNRNNSRAYSLLTPTASDTAEGGGSDMYVQINRIKKAAKMLQKSYDEEDYMQAIKLSMQQHSDDYSFLKAKEKDPPKYNIVHRYEIQGKGDGKNARPFIVVDSPTLDAPITLSRNVNGHAKGGKEQSWFPVYGHHNEWGHGGSNNPKVSIKHVKALEAHVRANPELSGKLEGVPTTDEFVEENFSDTNLFPRDGKGQVKHQAIKVGKKYTKGLEPFNKRAQQSPDGPERPVFDAWMAHIKSIAKALPKHSPNEAGKFEGEIEGISPKSPLYNVIYDIHHTRLGGEGGALARAFNYPSFETMNKIDPNSKHPEWKQEKIFNPIKRSSPEELISAKYPEGSGIREALLPMMRVIHDINENSDVVDSPVWTENNDGVEHHSINLQDIDAALDETNTVHLDAISNNVSPARAEAALISSPEFQALIRSSNAASNVIPKNSDGTSLSGVLKHTGTHDAPQTMHQILSNHVMGESAPFAATAAPSDDPVSTEHAEAEWNEDFAPDPKSTEYQILDSGKTPISAGDFNSLSPLRQRLMTEQLKSSISQDSGLFPTGLKGLYEDSNAVSYDLDEFSKRLNEQVEELKADLHGNGAIPEGQLWDEYSNRLEEITGIKAPPPSKDQQAAAQRLANEKAEATKRENAAIEEEKQKLIDAAAAETKRQEDAAAEAEKQRKLDEKFKEDEAAKANKVTDTTDIPDPTADDDGDSDSQADENSENTGNDSDKADDSQEGEETDTDEDSENNESKLSDEDKGYLNHLNDISGGGLDGFSPEDQQAAIVAYKSALEKSVSNRMASPEREKASNSAFAHAENRLSQAIKSGDSARLNNVISTIDNPENESDEGIEFNEDENQQITSLRYAIDTKESGSHPLDEIPKRVQLDIAQALVKINQNEQNNIDNDGKGVTDNRRENIESGAQRQREELIEGVRSGNLDNINNQVKLHRGDDNESATERATNQGRTGGTDGGGDGKPVVSAASRDAGKPGASKGAGAKGSDENVDGDSVGRSVSDQVGSNVTGGDKDDKSGDAPPDNGVQGRFEAFNGDDESEEEKAKRLEAEAAAKAERVEAERVAQAERDAAAAATAEEDPARKFRQQHLDDIGDEVLETLIKPRHMGYHDLKSLKITLLDSGKIKDDKFDELISTAEKTHAKNEEKSRRTSSKSNRALRDSIRNKKGLLDVVREHIKDHVATHDGRAFHDLKYKDLGSYARYLNSLSDDDRRKELEDHQKTAATRAEEKEKEEARAAEKEETEATKQKEEEDKAVWAVESKRVQEQMAAMPSILGSDGRKVSDQWDNSAALHYFRNLNKIVVHDTRVNLEKAGIDLSEISSLGSLLNALGAGNRIPTEIYGKITNSSSAINAVLTPRQKRDLAEEMETVDDYMGPEHRKQLSIENNQARNNQEDYQERQNDIIGKGLNHSIYSKTADDKYRDEDGKIIPLYSDPEDMKNKDEAEALRRQEDNVGEETSSEKAKRRTLQGHPSTESPGDGYAYHPETGQWVDRERFDSMAAHFDQHLKPGETTSFSPAHTVHTEHIGKDEDGKRSVILKAHEPLARGTKGASDYISVTKNKEGQIIWSPVKPPEQNKHGFISPETTSHYTGDPKLDERLDNAHAVGQYKGAWHALDHQEGSSADHARHGMQNNIIRHHNLGGQGAPKNVVPMDNDINGVLRKENFSNIAGNILNFSRKHSGSLAKKLKLNEMPEKVGQSAAGQKVGETAQKVGETAKKVGATSKDVTGLYSFRDVASLFYNPTAQPKLYRRLLFGSTKKDEALGLPSPGEGVAGAAKKVGRKVAPVVSDIAGRAVEDVSGAALAAGANIDRATARVSDAKEKVSDVKGKVTDKVREGALAGSEKINQATAASADKAGKIIDRTKEGASQFGQDIASTGMASVSADQPSSTGPPPETSKNKLTQDPAQTQRLRGAQAKLNAIRERQNSGVGDASRIETHGETVDAFHNFTVEDRAERDGITGTNAPDLTPVTPNRAQRRAAEGKGTKKRVGIPSSIESTPPKTPPTAAPQTRPRGGFEALT